MSVNVKPCAYAYIKVCARLEKTKKLLKLFQGGIKWIRVPEPYAAFSGICMMSAARYYELTNFLPYAVNVAIERKKKVNTLPEWPEIRIFYFDTSRVDLGVTEVRDGDNCFHIFDIEKTAVDIIYYRNKIGIEETSEVLRNYLKRRDRQIDRLYAYAKCLRCEKIVRTYLEVLV